MAEHLEQATDPAAPFNGHVEGVLSKYDSVTHLWVRQRGILCDQPALKAEIPLAWITATRTEATAEQLCDQCFHVVEDTPIPPTTETAGD